MSSERIKPFDHPDETEVYDLARIDTIALGGLTLQRFIFEPGWRWSENLKRIAGTDSCRRHHFGYLASGQLRVKLDSGEEWEIGPGEAFDIPSGHDAWVVGDAPAVLYDFGLNLAAEAEVKKAA